jgi:glucose/arabinose dehydrogenase
MPLQRPRPLFLIPFALSTILLFFWWRAGRRQQLNAIDLPHGFSIEIFADSVTGARSLALGDRGTVFVGSREAGQVYAILDRNEDGKAEEVLVLARALQVPNGIAFRDGSLYVAEISRILRFDSIEQRLRNPPAPVVVLEGLPREGHHGWKFIRFGPDGRLYVPVGAPCNACNPEDSTFATILSINPDGSDLRVEARGVRNSVGFDWDPRTGDLWFTDNGRDWMGENTPPDELNHRSRRGEHFGFPYCYGRGILDDDYRQLPCGETTPATVELGPHVAPLGMRFYSGAMFPDQYRGKVFIAEHGSWNRILASGYRITVVDVHDGNPGYEVFASGWENLNRAWGRPVDVLVMPDGALLVSDDRSDAVYRISFSP